MWFIVFQLSWLFFSSPSGDCTSCTIIPDNLLLFWHWLITGCTHIWLSSQSSIPQSIKPLMSNSFADTLFKGNFVLWRLHGGYFSFGFKLYFIFPFYKFREIPPKPFGGVVTCSDSSTILWIQRLSAAGCFSCLQSTIIAMRPTSLWTQGRSEWESDRWRLKKKILTE